MKKHTILELHRTILLENDSTNHHFSMQELRNTLIIEKALPSVLLPSRC